MPGGRLRPGTNTTTIVDHLEYNSFGVITSQSNTTYQPLFAYTGQMWDAAAGLYYYHARWYDASTGRFISQDPMSFAAGDANLYRYVNNDTLNRLDPTGNVAGAVAIANDGPMQAQPIDLQQIPFATLADREPIKGKIKPRDPNDPEDRGEVELTVAEKEALELITAAGGKQKLDDSKYTVEFWLRLEKKLGRDQNRYAKERAAIQEARERKEQQARTYLLVRWMNALMSEYQNMEDYELLSREWDNRFIA